jgi:hypothetical protein
MSRGNKYFLLLVDDLSRYMWVAVIPSKDHVVAAIKEIQARAEGESDLKLRAFRTNHRGEFTTRELDGARPYKPQQNSVVECRNGMVVATARSMLKTNGLSRWF